jgi:hypothetical protein
MDKKNKMKEVFAWIIFIIGVLIMIKNIYINLKVGNLETPEGKPIMEKTQ